MILEIESFFLNTDSYFIVAENQLAVAHTDRFFLSMECRHEIADCFVSQIQDGFSCYYLILYSTHYRAESAKKRDIVLFLNGYYVRPLKSTYIRLAQITFVNKSVSTMSYVTLVVTSSFRLYYEVG